LTQYPTPSLRRRFRRSTNAPWETEEWADLTIKESQSFLAALIYAIDNPWLYINDSIADNDTGYGHIKGRPEGWTAYYPSVEWTGIMDTKGRVILNDDSRRWHTSDHEKNPKTLFTGINRIGVVFRVIRDQFPDPTWNKDRSRWKATKLNAEPNASVNGSKPARSE